MEQDLNRIKLVLVEKKKTGKWLAQELGVSECTVSRWASNKAQPNLSSLNAIAIFPISFRGFWLNAK